MSKPPAQPSSNQWKSLKSIFTLLWSVKGSRFEVAGGPKAVGGTTEIGWCFASVSYELLQHHFGCWADCVLCLNAQEVEKICAWFSPCKIGAIDFVNVSGYLEKLGHIQISCITLNY